ncbi:MAG TPA: hypothetical protein PKA05_00940 [Roseiflexaceae bacterium]|nr:hypothetical protein [Roseiflexaceae bacterium]HMP38921.1 hypothetical protein [Roseiflexaceae bacterium]
MIRPATLADIWTIRRKPRSLVMLYHEAMLALPHRPAWFTLRSMLEASGRDGATFVFRERGMQAIAQSEGRNGRPEHDIVMLAAYGGGQGYPTDPDAWFRVLEVLCSATGRNGVQRFYAALSHRHDELREVFRQLGFSAYSQQMVLRLEGPDLDQGTTLAPMRPQSRRDVWAIQKLYGAVTPRTVQIAETRAARDWMLPLTRGWNRPHRRAWVVGRDDDFNAYLHLTSGPTAHVLTLLLRPEQRELTTDLLRFGLGQLPDTLPVYLLLREYQQELVLPASDLGFQPIGEQILLTRQSTVTVRRSILNPALDAQPEPNTPIATISSPPEDVRFTYARPARYHK